MTAGWGAIGSIALHVTVLAALAVALPALRRPSNVAAPLPVSVLIVAPPVRVQAQQILARAPPAPTQAAPAPAPPPVTLSRHRQAPSRPVRSRRMIPIAHEGPRDRPPTIAPQARPISRPSGPSLQRSEAAARSSSPDAVRPPAPPQPIPGDASCPPPRYPQAAQRRHEQGRVVIRVVVEADGTVGRASVQVSSSYPSLDTAALATIRGWRFHPALRDGKPVEGIASVPVIFRLNE